MNFAAAKEMSPYLEEPKAMPVGTPGKTGSLYLGFELDGTGKSILRDLERHAPLIVQQALYFDEEMPEMPCVYILSSGGPNVDGDRYRQHFVVRKDAFAHVSTGAATKLAEMRYNFSGLAQRFELEENAYLEYLPEPTIPRNSGVGETQWLLINLDSSIQLLNLLDHALLQHLNQQSTSAQCNGYLKRD